MPNQEQNSTRASAKNNMTTPPKVILDKFSRRLEEIPAFFLLIFIWPVFIDGYFHLPKISMQIALKHEIEYRNIFKIFEKRK